MASKETWGGSSQPGSGTATLRIIMKDLEMRRQIYDVNVAIGGHNYICLAAQMLGLTEAKITSKPGRQLSPFLGSPEGIKKFSGWAPATGLLSGDMAHDLGFKKKIRERGGKGGIGWRKWLKKRQSLSTLKFL